MKRKSSIEARIRIVEKNSPYVGYFRIDRYRLRHLKFDGSWTGELSREVFERGHAAAVLLYDPAADAVVMIEQFRIGAHAAGLDPWLVEIVAGIVEPGEAPDEVVRRETREEAGCEVTDLKAIGTFILSPGGTTETLALFCGRVESTAAGGVHGLAAEDEDIQVVVLPVDAALKRLAEGGIINATAVIAMQWLALNRQDLRKAWR